MQAIEFDRKLIDNYSEFSRSFLRVRAEDLKKEIDEHYDDGHFWPEPLLSINPAFEHGPSASSLADDGVLAKETARIFSFKDQPLRFHAHQGEAIAKAMRGQSYVVTTGTGSGKSLCFFVPIVDRAVRAKLAKQSPRTRAIIVYPMNALANSQMQEIEKFVGESGLPEEFRPTVARYTGQEDDTERRRVAANPPDILLTNFMMLELLLTRQDETDKKVIENARGLEFIVLDELHTYRGRQGADVAILVRRLRDRCRQDREPICIGTSATMASGDGADDPIKAVATVASRIFGTQIESDAIITESLRRATDTSITLAEAEARLSQALKEGLPSNLKNADLASHPLAVWVELELGIDEGKDRERRPPVVLKDAVQRLAEAAGVPADIAADKLAEFLGLMSRPENSRGGPSDAAFMAFKLHRFISGAGEVLTTLKSKPRKVRLEGQLNDPDDPDARLYPTRFCRCCGQEYHVVAIKEGDEGRTIFPRDIDDTPARDTGDEQEPGYLTPYEEVSDDFVFDGSAYTCPEDWLEDRRGELVLRQSRKKQLPRLLEIRPDGTIGEGGTSFWLLPGRFGFCVACGDQPSPQARERNKLGGLTAEGRSSATTTIVSAMLKAMNDPTIGVSKEKRKTLGFTDNRQDAALQAGHFNDSVFVTLLRGAVLRAVIDAGEEGLGDDEFGPKVQKALGYTTEHEALRRYWMADPSIKGANRVEASRTFARVLAHRIWADMQRGWRFTYPNLFGLDLIRPTFSGLDEFLSDKEAFERAPASLRFANEDQRQSIIETILMSMLEGLAIATDALDPLQTDTLKERSRSLLCAPWSIDAREELRSQAALVLDAPARRQQTKRDDMLILRAGARSGLARIINQPSLMTERLKADEYHELMYWLLSQLEEYGILRRIKTAADIPGWQVQPNALRLVVTSAIDEPAEGKNLYFRRLYLDAAEDLKRGMSALMGMESREHTAQVSSITREWREWRFRYDPRTDQPRIEENKAEMLASGEGTSFLPALFCSPTMELGVDISALNAVYLRNVPPTPANYAQRAGRAGRSGQAAMVATYCAAQSPHDQYFFRKRLDMVAGSVKPPAIDLANEELVRAHLQAVWLSETNQPLSANIPEVLDLQKEGLPIREEIKANISAAGVAKRAFAPMRRVLEALLDHFDGPQPDWLIDPDAWVRQTAASADQEFDRAFNRWRELYASARAQMIATQEKLQQTGLSWKDRNALEAQERAASQQVGILENGKASNGSDFYTYRYLATEGFLPGYNFPRLPLYAFVPAGGADNRAAYLQRARFLAISEFGPRSLIYHEGRAYRVHRAKLPPGSISADGKSLATGQIFICASCGAAHDTERERCHACDAPLAGCLPIRKTLRIDNVETLPAERITANDEERVRQGFEVQTVFAWPKRDGAIDLKQVGLNLEGEPLASLQYANSADIMRLNLGLKRRAEKTIMGFLINPATGYWAKQDDEVDEAQRDPEESYPERIVPIVQDRKNALLIRFSDPDAWSSTALTTAQHALLRGIEIVFQLEEGEVLGEPLPDKDNRRTILFYEATEGGAGVLARIMREPEILRAVVSEALSLMHFGKVEEAVASNSVDQLEDDPHAGCVKGCYRCLLSYYNQTDHVGIDRKDDKALALLIALANATPTSFSRPASEGDWIDRFNDHGLPSPDVAPLILEGVEIPYCWRSDYVAAVPGEISAATSDAARATGWELVSLPANPVDGVPEKLTQLLKGSS